MSEPGIRLPEAPLPAAPAEGNGTSGLAAGDQAAGDQPGPGCPPRNGWPSRPPRRPARASGAA